MYDLSMVRKVLSQTDKNFFSSFRARYPSWMICRLVDGTLVMVPPKKEALRKMNKTLED
jgi:hypothetical protein